MKPIESPYGAAFSSPDGTYIDTCYDNDVVDIIVYNYPRADPDIKIVYSSGHEVWLDMPRPLAKKLRKVLKGLL